MYDKDVIVIGGGAAGLTAGMYLARAGLDALVIEKGLGGGQAATTNFVENYPGFPNGVGGPELMISFMEQAQNSGCQIDYSDVREVRLTGDIKTVNGMTAKAVIIATGAERRKLGVSGETENIGRGVSYCATCDGAFYRGKEVAVIGGGNTALEDANYLSRMAKVRLIHRRSELRAKGKLVNAAMANENITMMLDTRVINIARENGMMRLDLEGGGSVSVNGVFIAVGTTPITDVFKGQIDMDENGYIIAGEDTVTSVSGVFCAGDCRKKPLRQIVTAASDGATAAYMAAEYI